MNIYSFSDGIVKKVIEQEEHSERVYLATLPPNFLEINDTLKKVSYCCHHIDVIFKDSHMTIILYPKESLKLFTKLSLSQEPVLLPVNERFKQFLSDLEEEMSELEKRY